MVSLIARCFILCPVFPQPVGAGTPERFERPLRVVRSLMSLRRVLMRLVLATAGCTASVEQDALPASAVEVVSLASNPAADAFAGYPPSDYVRR